MKKNLLLLIMLAILQHVPTDAHDFEVDGIYYLKNGSNATVTYPYSYSNRYYGEVNIPPTVTYNDTTYSVTAIGQSAFFYNEGLTNINIPNSVTSIGDNAFSGCSGLSSINIPNSVTSIGEFAFRDCVCLKNVNIPNSITYIKKGTFNGCTSINSVTIPNTIIAIDDEAFFFCISLTNVTLPNSISAIGNYAFEGCGFTSITIPKSVIEIGYWAFADCNNLSSISVESENTHYDSRGNCNAIIETSSNTLVAGCMNTVIPKSVTALGWGAFRGSIGLTSITIPNSVTDIGWGALSFCSALTNITIPNSVLTIGDAAFEMCNNLKSITIGSSVTYIGESAFYECNGLTNIYSLALTPPTVNYSTFRDRYSASLFVPEEAIHAYQSAEFWAEFTDIAGLDLTPHVNTFIADGIYYRITADDEAHVIANEELEISYIGNVVIPEFVTYNDHTFAVTGIESNAFDGCYELSSIVISNSVKTIGEQAFQGCTGLTNVIIGSGVTYIGPKAFNYCNALQTVTCRSTVPPVMANIDCFTTAIYNRAMLLVPRNFEGTYAATAYWSKFINIDGWGSAGLGDIDGDGIININDVTILIDVLLKGNIDNIYFESADMNYNNRLDIGDVTTLIDNLLNGN